MVIPLLAGRWCVGVVSLDDLLGTAKLIRAMLAKAAHLTPSLQQVEFD